MAQEILLFNNNGEQNSSCRLAADTHKPINALAEFEFKLGQDQEEKNTVQPIYAIVADKKADPKSSHCEVAGYLPKGTPRRTV